MPVLSRAKSMLVEVLLGVGDLEFGFWLRLLT
jgi:hypothetical protein